MTLLTDEHSGEAHDVVVLAQRLTNGDQVVAEATTEVRRPHWC